MIHTIFGLAFAQQPMLPPKMHRMSISPFPSRVAATVSGGFTTCYMTHLIVQDQSFNVMIDTGSSDTTLPLVGINDYTGITVNVTPQASTLNRGYGDGSSWSGFLTSLNVSLNANISALAPVALMTSQSTSPAYLSDANTNGLMGLGYAALSSQQTYPYTVMDAWVQDNLIPNRISFTACPYSLASQSVIDFGANTPYSKCGSTTPVATTISPVKTYHTIDVRAIKIGGVSQTLPNTFQTSDGSFIGMSTKAWSILDTCSSGIFLPPTLATALRNAVKNSGGLPTSFSSTMKTSFVGGSIAVAVPESSFQWSKIPTLSFTLPSSTGGTFDLVLGPRQYIQPDEDGFYYFLVYDGSAALALLGVPLFSNYFVQVDRSSGSIGFGPGCGCDTSPDGYPKILFNVSSTTSTSATSTATSTSTSTAKTTVTTVTTTFTTKSSTLASTSSTLATTRTSTLTSTRSLTLTTTSTTRLSTVSTTRTLSSSLTIQPTASRSPNSANALHGFQWQIALTFFAALALY